MKVFKLFLWISLSLGGMSVCLAQVGLGVRVGGGVSNFPGEYQRTQHTRSGEPFPVLRRNAEDTSDSEAAYSIVNQAQDFVLSYQGGLFFNIPLGKLVNFIPEIDFALRGTSETVVTHLADVTDTTALVRQPVVPFTTRKSNVQLGYLTVLSPFQFNLPLGFNVHVGPYFAIRLLQRREDTIQDHIKGTTHTKEFGKEDFRDNIIRNFLDPAPIVDFTAIYRSGDIGMVLGIGYALPANLGIALRYERSFLDVISSGVPERNRLESSHVQQVATLSVNYTILQLK